MTVKRSDSQTVRQSDGQTVHERMMAVADRLYQRDRDRFRKLLVWILSSRKSNWTDARIYQALLALEKREAAGAPVDAWWPWLNAALRKIRTMELQAESQGYKHGDLNSVKTILRKLFADSLTVGPSDSRTVKRRD